MIEFKSSEKRICDFCGGIYNHLRDLSTVNDVTVTMCKHCRKDLVMSLVNITVD